MQARESNMRLGQHKKAKKKGCGWVDLRGLAARRVGSMALRIALAHLRLTVVSGTPV